MATFAYVGKTRHGAVKKGEVIAKTRDEAIEQLRKLNVGVTNLQEKALTEGILARLSGTGIKDKDLVVFTRQFSTMINAGLPLVQCLDILSTQSENFCPGGRFEPIPVPNEPTSRTMRCMVLPRFGGHLDSP